MPADVKAYLSARTGTHANAAIYQEFENLYERKLWHQLTVLLLDVTTSEDIKSDLIPTYNDFINAFELDMNPLSLVVILQRVAAHKGSDKEAAEFLVSKKETVKTHKDASLSLSLAIGQYHLKQSDLTAVKAILEGARPEVENNDMVPLDIRGEFYALSSGYEKQRGNFTNYYRDALRQLGCVSDTAAPTTLSPTEQQKEATDLAVAALLSDDIYNFGELLAHPILTRLEGTNDEWVLQLIRAFNAGDVDAYEKLQPQWMTHSDLVANLITVRGKMSLTALVNLIFKRPVDGRVIAFKDIAAAAKISDNEVELLIMAAISRKLIEATIDGVAETTSVFWVHPRVLDRVQIGTMATKLEQWAKSVEGTIATTSALDADAVFREE
ncbi:hypothetical protein SARC_07815 [Sphaeroforma arctica JP610]|uniref:PCI domain-containing protein n=1 Tax=Sphaeroforma arctica JP610 TaxID=667725 RepID=A0A0L0FV37_9EUKA|nr:hypothetical protein SARC_07815 [Sphaeroforma arctica JP610]KNC79803.1 hypothetical protein SARC_07815 [Sphaeroforma arctica JP610]|eukprot:XP_014153705.1 hypothetical protein SARC_07815 [Sphaeroforma arctica JP610]